MCNIKILAGTDMTSLGFFSLKTICQRSEFISSKKSGREDADINPGCLKRFPGKTSFCCTYFILYNPPITIVHLP